MMAKYLGIILVSGAISLYGAYLSGKIQEQIALRKALYDLLLHIKCCIDNGALPLPQIYSLFKNPVLEKYGILEYLKRAGTDGIKAALNESTVKIDENIKSLYVQLSDTLGKSAFRTTESETLSRYISLIEIEEQKLIKNDQAKKELYKKLGILCGLMAALVLV